MKPRQPRRRAESAPSPTPAASERPKAPRGPRREVERLAKLLAAAGVASRRECEEYIRLGRVSIDGEIVTDVATKVDLQKHDVRFDDSRIKPEPKVYWWLNKPKGVLCTSRDEHGRRTVLDLLPRIGKRVYSVGRLDEDSTGLLLLTNDGEMALRLTHPRYQISKTYVALVAGKVTLEDLDKLQQGVWLADGKVRASRIVRIGTHGQATRLKIELREGKNREIRRMFAKLGHKVMGLHRIAIGPLKIRKLSMGEARPVAPDELFVLRQMAGLERGAVASGIEAPPRPSVRTKPKADEPSTPPSRRPSAASDAPPQSAPAKGRRPARPPLPKGRGRRQPGPAPAPNKGKRPARPTPKGRVRKPSGRTK